MKSYVEEHMRTSLAGHILDPHESTEKIKAFYLRRPGQGRMMSCLITFTAEGIVIQGDLTPGQNGVISVCGYCLAWFADRKSEDYLCEKFLRKEFVPELALRSFRERVLMYRRDGSIPKDRAREAFDWIASSGGDGMPAEEFFEAYWGCFRDSPDGCGYGYNPADAGWLCAIQQRFAALYAEMKERAA